MSQEIPQQRDGKTDTDRLRGFCEENFLARLLCGYFGTRTRRRPVYVATLEQTIARACKEKNKRPPRHSDVVKALKGIEKISAESGIFGEYVEGRHGHKSRFEFTDELIAFGNSLEKEAIDFDSEPAGIVSDEEEFELSDIVEDVEVEQKYAGQQTYPELETTENELEENVADDRPVTSQPNDWNVETLRGKFDRGYIELQPEYQREFVWELKPELPSRLIESILLEIPIPPIYFGKIANGKLELIDGQQRLTTLIRFVKNEFQLSKLERLSSLNGKMFRDLEESTQSKILDTSIRSVVIDTGTNDSLRYEIFERFNRGSVALNQQELRNCVYRGKFNDLLRKLVEDSIWRKVKGTDKPDPRFIEREMILRLFALHSRLDYFAGNLKQFLNDYMKLHAPKDEETLLLQENMFHQMMQNVFAVFGQNSARIYVTGEEGGKTVSGSWNPKFSISALDIQASALFGQPRERVQAAADQIREAYILFLLTNENIREAISGHTASTKATKLRWTAFKGQVAEILNGTKVEPRFFSFEFRKELYAKDSMCQLCRNPIYDFDEAAVDHIVPYAKSGRTIRENAQIAHRWCNSKKCKNDSINFEA